VPLLLQDSGLPHYLSLLVTILEAMFIEYFYFDSSFLAKLQTSSISSLFSLALVKGFFSLSDAIPE
jgi:hypothetical protein